MAAAMESRAPERVIFARALLRSRTRVEYIGSLLQDRSRAHRIRFDHCTQSLEGVREHPTLLRMSRAAVYELKWISTYPQLVYRR
jgi:hypothetical protein